VGARVQGGHEEQELLGNPAPFFGDRREHFFEAARQQAQREYELDNTNAQVGFVSRLQGEAVPPKPASGLPFLAMVAGFGQVGRCLAGVGTLQAWEGVRGDD
jgi:hypothetical protein